MKNNRLWRIRLTNRCNANCIFCHGEGIHLSSTAMDISVNYVQHLLETVIDADDSIALSGGEPLLHPELEYIIRCTVTKVGEKCHLNTNGILLEKKLNILFMAGLKNIHVNLATLDGKIYKNLYGVDFPLFLWNTLRDAVELGFHININVVVLQGYNECDSFAIDLLKRCEKSCFDATFIEPHNALNSKSDGTLFQEYYQQLLTSKGFNLIQTMPGRKIYKREKCHVRIASPCAPAMAWNGSPKDDAFVVLENEEIRKFSTGEVIKYANTPA
ncbi:MAG: radical SAM protein [Candidatus Aminicenantes bacterium]|nr:radical SAM protein [Candidatus Aminicenantes bacterium]